MRKFGRVYIKTNQPEEAARKLSRVFGIASTSPATETTSSLSNIAKLSVKLAKTRLKREQSFAIRCHRVGKHTYTSQEVCSRVGRTLLTKLPDFKLRVDLTRPNLVLNIEVREDKAYLFTDTIKAAGGLPLGTQPKLVCLLNGDISSTVSCWMTMKRGCPPVLINLQKTAEEATSLRRVLEASQKLLDWAIGFPRTLYVVELRREFLLTIRKHPSEIRNLLCQRFMLNVARRLAQRWKAEGIVTGDSLRKGVFPSLHAFRISDEAAGDYPVHRPVVALGSQEIAEIARLISLTTATIQETNKEPESKTTGKRRTDLEDIKRIEEEIDIEKMVEESLKTLKALKV